MSRPLSGGGQRATWKAYGVWLTTATAPAGYTVGSISTPHGVVGLYIQSDMGHPHTQLTFVVGGKQHRIWWDRTFTDRWLKTLARTFAEECSR